ncbi:MAG: hypothetical protein ACRCZY_11855 [Phocaeicola sp.]
MKLLDSYKTFKDEDSCKQYLRELREKDGVVWARAVATQNTTGINSNQVGFVQNAIIAHIERKNHLVADNH